MITVSLVCGALLCTNYTHDAESGKNGCASKNTLGYVLTGLRGLFAALFFRGLGSLNRKECERAKGINRNLQAIFNLPSASLNLVDSYQLRAFRSCILELDCC